MALHLKPWPFKKDEEVELYWLCSPYFDVEKGWMMQVVFRRADNKIVEVTLPWGTLPYLVIGQKYSNGVPLLTGKSEQAYQITIPDRNIFEIGKAYDIPASLYYFYKNQNYGFQRICKFSVGDRNYYIPCLEIVRNFLTPHKVLANYIMKPGGLDLLIMERERKGQKLFIELTNEIKGSLVCNETACYLAWLKYDIYANKAWYSVYNKVFSSAIAKNPYNATEELHKGTYIDVIPPVGKGSKWVFRGVNVGKDTLIFEILSKTNLYMPFESIEYTHPSLTEMELVNADKKVRIIKSETENKDVELDKSGEGANKTPNELIIDNISMGFSFNKNPQMKRVRMKKQTVNIGSSESTMLTRSLKTLGEDVEVATTTDWIYGGDVKPLEFKSLEIVSEHATEGLADFLKVIEYINTRHIDMKLSMNIIFLPKGKAFSYYPDGTRRNCAIVKVEREKMLPCYIIEIGRLDKWSVSTLIIHQLVALSNQTFEEILTKLFEKLIDNSGHWDKQSIEKEVCLMCEMLKHVTGQSVWAWKGRIVDKI